MSNQLYRWNSRQDNFYDLVIMIMDQLVSEGSLAAGLRLYADKDEFKKVEDNYKNHVYTFDGKSEYIANHAMTIVGYGILEDKVYWLIQNSLGPN